MQQINQNMLAVVKITYKHNTELYTYRRRNPKLITVDYSCEIVSIDGIHAYIQHFQLKLND